MSNRFTRLFTHMKLPLMLVVPAILFVASPAYAGDTPCGSPVERMRGDHLRLLRVWACGYSSDRGNAERGRVVMVTYRWTRLGPGREGWREVTSPSISLLSATVTDSSDRFPYPTIDFGQRHGGNCRVGSPGGSIGCSVPNTKRVTFYGPAWDRLRGHRLDTVTFTVGWRDDQGFPHSPRTAAAVSLPWTSR
jgi:hypothetical protein